MRLQDYLDTLNLQLNIIRHNNQNERWSAQFERCEIKKGSILSGEYGSGSTPDEAILDYIKKIKGKVIVINVTNEKERQQYSVPMNITYGYLND